MNCGDAPKAIQRAKAELLVVQSYDVAKHETKEEDFSEFCGLLEEVEEVIPKEENESSFDVSSLYKLKTERKVVPGIVETLKPTDICALRTGEGMVSLRFTCLGPDVLRVLSECEKDLSIQSKCLLTKRGENEGREYDLEEERVMGASHSHRAT